jgi:hypothetical protein
VRRTKSILIIVQQRITKHTTHESENALLPFFVALVGKTPLSPFLLHQPFSAPGNPYARTNGSDATVVAQPPVRNSGGSEEKDLPEKPKGRERSLTIAYGFPGAENG